MVTDKLWVTTHDKDMHFLFISQESLVGNKGSYTGERALDGKISHTQGKDFLSPMKLCRFGDQ